MDEWKEAILNIVYDDSFEQCKQLQKEHNFTFYDFPSGILAVYEDAARDNDVKRLNWLKRTYLSNLGRPGDALKTTSSSS